MNDKTILIVEDEAIFSLQLKLDLQDRGYTVSSVVSSGNKSVEAAKKDNPDLILMDISLTDEMSGLEAAEKIREFSKAPIIFISGYNDPTKEGESAALDNTVFLSKPVPVSKILEIIKQLTG